MILVEIKNGVSKLGNLDNNSTPDQYRKPSFNFFPPYKSLAKPQISSLSIHLNQSILLRKT